MGRVILLERFMGHATLHKKEHKVLKLEFT